MLCRVRLYVVRGRFVIICKRCWERLQNGMWILNDLINFRQKNLQHLRRPASNLPLLINLPYFFFDLRSAKESVTDDPKSLTGQCSTLKEEEFVVKQIENELVVLWAKPKRSGKFFYIWYDMAIATTYHSYKIALTDGQKKKLPNAFAEKSAVTKRAPFWPALN